MNGSVGSPGINARTPAAPAAIASGFGLPPNWRIMAMSAEPSTLPFVTTMPAAVETSSAGIWLTSPSPTVSVVKVAAASANGMPWRSSPIARPPTMLMTVISSAAMASPRTNFAAPSMAPKKPLSSSSSRRRRRAVFSSMRPEERSASIAICLPGMASRLKRAATSAMRPEPLVMTMKFTTRRMAKSITPITTSPPIRNPPKACTTWPAAPGPSAPWLRMSRVVATLSERRSSVVSSRRVGKLVKSSGRVRNIATISTRTDAVTESARPRSSSTGGSGSTNTASSATTPRANPTSVPGSMGRARLNQLVSIRRRRSAVPCRAAYPVGAAPRPRIGRNPGVCCEARGSRCPVWLPHGSGCPACDRGSQ